MKHISSLASGVALGSAGIIMMNILSGCEAPQEKQQNYFLVIEQLTNGKYTVVEKTPTEGPNRAIIREKDANGNVTERVMSEEEMKTLADQEYQKVQNGTSETVQNGSADAGMGLAGTILAVAAGSLLGNMIGNALMNNKSFSRNSATTNQSVYNRSSGTKPTTSESSTKKSFFNSPTKTSTTTNTTSYGG